MSTKLHLLTLIFYSTLLKKDFRRSFLGFEKNSSGHLLLPLGILLSIPAAYGTMDVFARFFAEIDGMLMTVSIGPKSYLVTILLVCLGYIGSLFLLRRKITKVNMIESLKDNRE